MPSNYAHLLFAEKVLPLLDTGLAHEIKAQLSEYMVGSLGPDILSFKFPPFASKVAKFGGKIHGSPVKKPLESLRVLIKSGAPYAKSYAAGFICHFALDSACHHLIDPYAQRVGLSHVGLETELDRYLAELEGKDPLRFKPFKSIKPSSELFRTLTGLYSPLSADTLAHCYRSIRSTSNMLISMGGTPLELCTRPVPFTRGVVMTLYPRADCLPICQELLGLMLDALPTAAFLIDSFMLSVKTNSPLDSAFDKSFMGGASPKV